MPTMPLRTRTWLTIRFDRKDFPDYVLPRRRGFSAGIPALMGKLVLQGAALIHDGDTFNVYRGVLRRPDGKQRTVVVKLGWRDSHRDAQEALEHEFELYNGPLKALQDDVVPACYGLFHGRTEHGVVTCLLLDSLGDHANKDIHWVDFGPDEKLELVNQIRRGMHRAGVEHNDLDASNIIRYRDHWWIIDFEHADYHTCGVKMNIVEGAMNPSTERFGCDELWHVSMDLGVWRPGMVHLSGVWFDEGDIRTRDDLVMLARRKGFDFEANGEHINEAIDKIWVYLTAIRAREDKCQPREYWYYLGEDVEPAPDDFDDIWLELYGHASQGRPSPDFGNNIAASAPPTVTEDPTQLA